MSASSSANPKQEETVAGSGGRIQGQPTSSSNAEAKVVDDRETPMDPDHHAKVVQSTPVRSVVCDPSAGGSSSISDQISHNPSKHQPETNGAIKDNEALLQLTPEKENQIGLSCGRIRSSFPPSSQSISDSGEEKYISVKAALAQAEQMISSIPEEEKASWLFENYVRLVCAPSFQSSSFVQKLYLFI